MPFFEDLLHNATGIKTDRPGVMGQGLLGSMNQRMSSMLQNDPTSTDLLSPPVNNEGVVPSTLGTQSKPQFPGAVTDPTGTYRIDPNTGKRIYIDRKTGLPQAQTPTTKKTNTLEDISKDKNLFKNIFNMDVETMKKTWEDKGGFDGLMANPAFQLGVAIMQSSARGKSIGADLFDNAAKAGAISTQYAEKLKARRGVLAPITDDQRATVEAVLSEDNYYEPGVLDRLKKGNQQAKYREGLDLIYEQAEKLAEAESKRLNKKVRFDRRHIRQALKDLERTGKIKKRDPSFFGIRGGTIEATGGIQKREQGGPVNADQPYIVGEKGAEMFVPEVDGNIIKNDDAKVVNMLLESNPQLQNISRARAVKILKARFPDYF